MEDVYWKFVHAGKAKDVAALTPSDGAAVERGQCDGETAFGDAAR